MMTNIQKGTFEGTYNINNETIYYEKQWLNYNDIKVQKLVLSSMYSYQNKFSKVIAYTDSEGCHYDDDDTLFSLDATQEHMAKLFIGKKSDIEAFFNELIKVMESSSLFTSYLKHRDLIELCQCDLVNDYSILHVITEDCFELIESCEQKMDEKIMKTIQYSFTSPDLFNSYYRYGDDWFLDNTDNHVLLSYYQTYKNDSNIDLSFSDDDNDFEKVSQLLKALEEKDNLEKNITENKKENIEKIKL
jgi:hypothetical protein